MLIHLYIFYFKIKNDMTKSREHQINATKFIDDIINKSKLSYEELMTHLDNKKEDWKSEHLKLSKINLFDMHSEEYDRKNYLHALITYSEKLIFKHKNKKLYVLYKLKKV